MSTTQVSIDTAPRDIEGLRKCGRFNLRVLANLLGVFETEEGKTAFMSGSNDDQADTIFALLAKKDGKPVSGKGGGGAPTGRTPSTKNAGKAASTATKPVGAAAAGSGGGGETTGSQGVGGAATGAGAEKILAALKALGEKIDAQTEAMTAVAESITQLQGVAAGTNRFVALSIGLAGKLAEETLGAPLASVLQVVLEDMPAVEEAMRNMPGAEVGDGDEEVSEGNEE